MEKNIIVVFGFKLFKHLFQILLVTNFLDCLYMALILIPFTMSSMDRMISKMSKRYPMLLAMGFMIVVIAFIIGFFNSQTAAAYFAEEKTVRETNSEWFDERASIESIALWLPYFKFLGLGLILGGIVMALRRIIDNLKGVGKQVLSNVDESQRPSMPSPPRYAMLMPLLMMLGELIFIIALIISLGNAAKARSIYANPIPDVDTDPALVSQLAQVKATDAWLVPLKFFGIATEFLAIVIGLMTIIYILTAQTKGLDKAINVSRS